MDPDIEDDQVNPWSWLAAVFGGIFVVASLASYYQNRGDRKYAKDHEKSRQERLAHFERRQQNQDDEIRETEERKAREAEANMQRRNNRKQLEELQERIRSEQGYTPQNTALNGGFRNTINRFKPAPKKK